MLPAVAVARVDPSLGVAPVLSGRMRGLAFTLRF